MSAKDSPRTAIADLDLIRHALTDKPDALAEFEKHIGNDRDALGFALAANIGPIRAHAIETEHEHDPDKCDECQEMVMEALRD